MRISFYITACTVAFFSGFITGESVFAQEKKDDKEWVQKPIQCDTLAKISQIQEQKGEQIVWAGRGYSNSVNFDQPVQVVVFLSFNPETKSWSLIESGAGNTGCLIGYGDNFTIDKDTMKKYSENSSSEKHVDPSLSRKIPVVNK